MKIAFGVSAFLAAWVFNNSQSTLHEIQIDLKAVSQKVFEIDGHMEGMRGQIQRNQEDIKELKSKKR